MKEISRCRSLYIKGCEKNTGEPFAGMSEQMGLFAIKRLSGMLVDRNLMCTEEGMKHNPIC